MKPSTLSDPAKPSECCAHNQLSVCPCALCCKTPIISRDLLQGIGNDVKPGTCSALEEGRNGAI
ncbi:hypothetical protein GUITHDRAFT_151315 [Guillardia theta CCMP2712]|uniref:Uncharacterized protein n=1 Tax=Guillardia theta (strain CCMP2712) TaxID=905079 RepID=L1JP80_GUITC|nr:hypothetical protein GUITHDRAFT_151315 [Guillardia theta CCMP2712]EKX49858.1 hypothetical protein GUITHDRAFT_151315 [Guillardia theta CCMP2712]|eukprot:XP_005836838.1 hypothetical protein GUITHDRAFT_151315 [Guillardia theta CCMP2712]